MFNKELLRQKMVGDIMGHPVYKLHAVAVDLNVTLYKYSVPAGYIVGIH